MQNHSPSDLDRLGDEIAELSAHLDAATARLLTLIREFDARGGWNSGFRSCAAWLSWRVGLDLGAARERVRVARALETLPLLAEALARGELSYAKVRALTRVATPETEARLLGVGRAGTAAHVERIVRGWRCVDRRAEAREATLRHAGRALHVHHDEDGMVVVRGRLEPEVGALLVQALAAARETLYQRAVPAAPRAAGVRVGSLCHGAGGHEGGHRCRRGLMLSTVLEALHQWLDSWPGIGVIERGMARQGYDLQLTRYANEGGGYVLCRRPRALRDSGDGLSLGADTVACSAGRSMGGVEEAQSSGLTSRKYVGLRSRP